MEITNEEDAVNVLNDIISCKNDIKGAKDRLSDLKKLKSTIPRSLLHRISMNKARKKWAVLNKKKVNSGRCSKRENDPEFREKECKVRNESRVRCAKIKGFLKKNGSYRTKHLVNVAFQGLRA